MQKSFPPIIAIAISFAGCQTTKRSSWDWNPSDWAAHRTTPEAATQKLRESWVAVFKEAREIRAEAMRKSRVDRVAHFEKEKAYADRAWREFLAKIQPGDEFWFYSALPGRLTNEGYAIVRNGRMVHRYPTAFF